MWDPAFVSHLVENLEFSNLCKSLVMYKEKLAYPSSNNNDIGESSFKSKKYNSVYIYLKSL